MFDSSIFVKKCRPWKNGASLKWLTVALWFFRESGPVLLENPIFLWFFGGVRTPCPPSGSAHVLLLCFKLQQTALVMKKTATLCFFVCYLLLTLNKNLRTNANSKMRRFWRLVNNIEECCIKKGCPLKSPIPGLICNLNYIKGCTCDPIKQIKKILLHWIAFKINKLINCTNWTWVNQHKCL